MKYALIITIGFTGFILSSCQQQSPPAPNPNPQAVDTVAPVITISGGNSQSQMAPQVVGTGTWTNPAATALDNVDGNVSANIAITGVVDPNTVGFDTLYYTVADAAGNSNTDTLIVQITPYSFVHLAPYLGGVYNCADTCSVIGSYYYPSTWTCDTTFNDKVVINNFAAFGTSYNVECTVDTAMQVLNFNYPFSLGPANCSALSGTASYTHNGNSVHVVISFLWTDGTSTETCVSHYNK